MNYKILNIIQGSQEWLSLRKTKITATDTAKIMNLSPFCTPLQLWEEKLGLREPQPINDKMREGTLLEEEAREFINKSGTDFKPIVLESVEFPFMMASLDGMNSSGDILEIKCGVSSFINAEVENIEPYYYSQCQKQMFVANRDTICYCAYRNPEKYKCITIKRDDTFIEKMIEAEKQFYQCLQNFTPPPSTDRDFIKREDRDWYKHTEILKDTIRQRKLLEAKEECLKNEIIAMCDGQSSQGNGIRVSKVLTKGRVQYDAIPELKEIDLEKYRSKPVSSFRFTEVKNKDD